MYFGFQFAKAAKTLPGYAVRHYVDTLATDPEALHASFAIYRALDATIAQNEERRTRRLTLPVLAIGGAEGIGEGAANTMRLAADDVQSVVIPGSGHYYSRGAAGGADHVPGPLSGRAGRGAQPLNCILPGAIVISGTNQRPHGSGQAGRRACGLPGRELILTQDEPAAN